MIPKVNPEPVLPQKTGGLSLAGLEQYDKDFLSRTREELRAHAFAVNRLIPVRGVWSPTITCATPGNLTVAYGLQEGRYELWDGWVWLMWELETTTFTHSTASGEFQLIGLPKTPVSFGMKYAGTIPIWSGFSAAAWNNIGCYVEHGHDHIHFMKMKSGQTSVAVDIDDWNSGTTVHLHGIIRYRWEPFEI